MTACSPPPACKNYFTSLRWHPRGLTECGAVPAPNQFFFLLMSSVPSDLSLLRLPRGESVVYPTGRPSIRVVMREIAALGYEVSGFSLHQTDDLQPLTPGVWHWAVVIGEIREIILFIVIPATTLSSESSSSDSLSDQSGYVSSHNKFDSDNVDLEFPQDGYCHRC